MTNRLLVTGGAGFIGANFVLMRIAAGDQVMVLDKLTYAGNLQSLAMVENAAGYTFVRGEIEDRELVGRLLAEYRPDAVVHFAAESHVDRSILGPEAFVMTNVVGTFRLLDATLEHWRSLDERARSRFRFLHVSTDEVYGSLGPSDAAFHESTPYSPNSPYSASKAGSDHLVRAYHHTYGLPTLTTNCSNNYGPLQFPEKLIPLMILNALNGKPLPVYGDGLNVRDWLYVGDHCAAIATVLAKGRPGETYNVGGLNEMPNITVVQTICDVLDELRPAATPRRELITYVKDRPGHDRRYAIDCRKVTTELGWKPQESFSSGIRKTIAWYLANMPWVEGITSGAYREWMDRNYTGREIQAATTGSAQ
ncbi:MAG TPA: dTDP-glucose 4,6-dehydratase [Acidobacteriaceae bacterium]|jgi:dTDP-glucose 4,6-dehydratase